MLSRAPILYQINTRIALREIGPAATLDDLSDSLLDDLALKGIDIVWMLGVWQTGPAGRANLDLEFRRLGSKFRKTVEEADIQDKNVTDLDDLK